MSEVGHTLRDDDAHVHVSDNQGRGRWARKLGVSEQELVAIVNQVGDDLGAVEAFIHGSSGPH